MEKPKRIACHRCRSKHLKCNGAWPECGRCNTLGLSCRYQSPVRFVNWSEQEFQANQKWVRSSAKTFCIDKSVPSAAWRPLAGLLDHSEDDLPADDTGRGSPVSIVSEHDSTAEPWDETTELPEGDILTDPRLQHVPPSESHRHGFLEDPALSLQDPGTTKLSESPQVIRGLTDTHPAYSDQTSPSVPTPSTSHTNDPLAILSQNLLRYFHIPSFSHGPYASSSNTTNPTTHIPSLKARKFPLVDFLEAYLFKYFIDDVAPWLDIADPDRYFELVVPIIARSSPPLLCAVLALAARHLLSAPPGPAPTGRRCYKAAVRARVSKISVIELVVECLPSLRAYDVSPEDERPGLLTTLVLLRQAELLDRDSGPADRCFSPSAGSSADTFLPVFNNIVQGPEFERMMRRSGLAQAAYMLALRQEMYYSMASGRPPSVALAGCPPFHPFAYEMTVNMIRVLGACWCNERAGRAPAEVLDQLMQRQRDLKDDILLGIRPIFEHRASLADDGIPTLWYASKTEVYLVQLSKIALAILVNSRPRDELSDVMNGRNHVDSMRDLLRDTFAIALGRGESPHAMFHASMMAKLLRDTPVGEEAGAVLQRCTERLKEMKIWPFRHIVELHWG